MKVSPIKFNFYPVPRFAIFKVTQVWAFFFFFQISALIKLNQNHCLSEIYLFIVEKNIYKFSLYFFSCCFFSSVLYMFFSFS